MYLCARFFLFIRIHVHIFILPSVSEYTIGTLNNMLLYTYTQRHATQIKADWFFYTSTPAPYVFFKHILSFYIFFPCHPLRAFHSRNFIRFALFHVTSSVLVASLRDNIHINRECIRRVIDDMPHKKKNIKGIIFVTL